MSWTIKSFDENSILVAELIPKITSALVNAINKKGKASLVVSGGSTPKKLFVALSECELPWDKVAVTLVDERWVDESHADSNARLVKEFLLTNKAKAAKFISLTNIESGSDDGEKNSPFGLENTIENKILEIEQPYTVVILGMGGDGHTASFFPGSSTLEKAMYPENNEVCVAVSPPSAPHERMTLTLPTLLNCENLILHIVGVEKWRVLQKAIQPGAALELPIRAVLYQYKKTLEIFYAAK
ncbi:MAG: 6-phosphogluconolactonase [Cellvibrionaceae bacterium]